MSLLLRGVDVKNGWLVDVGRRCIGVAVACFPRCY